jgi:hypothetical protein
MEPNIHSARRKYHQFRADRAPRHGPLATRATHRHRSPAAQNPSARLPWHRGSRSLSPVRCSSSFHLFRQGGHVQPAEDQSQLVLRALRGPALANHAFVSARLLLPASAPRDTSSCARWTLVSNRYAVASALLKRSLEGSRVQRLGSTRGHHG